MPGLFYCLKTSLLILSGTALLLTTMGCTSAMSRYESPKYSLVLKDGPFEVRWYESALAASVVTYDGDSGFRTIFDFISGKNSSNQNISMTIPVRKEIVGGKGSSKLSFFMPSDFDADSLPSPIDSRVRVESFEDGLYGIVRFSGSSSDEVVEKRRLELLKWLESLNYGTRDRWYLDRYDPPWTLPFLRANEVAIRLVAQDTERK